jgi:hypothetical protein
MVQQLARRYSCSVEKNLQVVPVTVHRVFSLTADLFSSNDLVIPLLSDNDRVVIVIAAMQTLDICASRKVSDVFKRSGAVSGG